MLLNVRFHADSIPTGHPNQNKRLRASLSRFGRSGFFECYLRSHTNIHGNLST